MRSPAAVQHREILCSSDEAPHNDGLRTKRDRSHAALGGGFAEYAEARDALSRPLLSATDAIASFAWDVPALQAHHQALNRAMKLELRHIVAMEPARVLAAWRQSEEAAA